MIGKYAEIFCWKNVSSFCSAKATHIFSAKNIRILYIESAKTDNEMTLNQLVKLTTLWTTGPRLKEYPDKRFSYFFPTGQCYIPNIKRLGLALSDKKIFKVFCYISLCKTCLPWGVGGGEHFWPQGYNLNNLSRGPLGEVPNIKGTGPSGFR